MKPIFNLKCRKQGFFGVNLRRKNYSFIQVLVTLNFEFGVTSLFICFKNSIHTLNRVFLTCSPF